MHTLCYLVLLSSIFNISLNCCFPLIVSESRREFSWGNFHFLIFWVSYCGLWSYFLPTLKIQCSLLFQSSVVLWPWALSPSRAEIQCQNGNLPAGIFPLPPFLKEPVFCYPGPTRSKSRSALERLQHISSLRTSCTLKDRASCRVVDMGGLNRGLLRVEAWCRNAQHPNGSLKRSLWEVLFPWLGKEERPGKAVTQPVSQQGLLSSEAILCCLALSHPPCCHGSVKTLCCCFSVFTKLSWSLTSSLPPPTARSPTSCFSAPSPWLLSPVVPSVLGGFSGCELLLYSKGETLWSICSQ